MKATANELPVKLLSSVTRWDPEIARAAGDDLAWNIPVPPDVIGVEVERRIGRYFRCTSGRYTQAGLELRTQIVWQTASRAGAMQNHQWQTHYPWPST